MHTLFNTFNKSLLVIPAFALLLVGVGCEQETATAPEATPPEAVSSEAPAAAGVCVVSGEALGSMGEPVVYAHAGTEYKFCCASCIDQFKANPEKFIASTGDAAADGHDHSVHDQVGHESH